MQVDESQIAAPEGGAKERERLRKLDVWRWKILRCLYFTLCSALI